MSRLSKLLVVAKLLLLPSILFLAVNWNLDLKGMPQVAATDLAATLETHSSRARADLKTRLAYQFLSPNVDENLTLSEASIRLQSPEQKKYQSLCETLLDTGDMNGLHIQAALGDWSDGLENSILVTIPGTPDFETLRYASARFGLLAKQKSVLFFQSSNQGQDAVYELDVPERNVSQLRKVLDQHNIMFRTIVPLQQGHRVVVFDEGSKLRSNLELLGTFYQAAVHVALGKGEFLGKQTRAEAEDLFYQVIHDFETSRTVQQRKPHKLGSPRLLMKSLVKGYSVRS